MFTEHIRRSSTAFSRKRGVLTTGFLNLSTYLLCAQLHPDQEVSSDVATRCFQCRNQLWRATHLSKFSNLTYPLMLLFACPFLLMSPAEQESPQTLFEVLFVSASP